MAALNGLAMGIIPMLTRLVWSWRQSGSYYHYAFAMVLGNVPSWSFVTLGGRGKLMLNLLPSSPFTPAIAALILAVFPRGRDEVRANNAKWVGFVATLGNLCCVPDPVGEGIDPADTGFQFVEEHEWILGLTYRMGVTANRCCLSC